jgi:hypothetical protein
MMRQRQVFASLLFGGAVVFVLGLGALAQSVSLTVTAYSDAVRFSAQGSVKELRVEILALSGQKVFDSGPVLGNALDWKLLNSQGQPVANGVYLYTVTVKDPSGNVTKKLGKLAVLRGKGVAAPPLSGITVGELATGKERLAPQAYSATDWFVSGQLGVGTDTPTYKAEVLDDTDAPLNQTVLRVSRVGPGSGVNTNTFLQVENYLGPAGTIGGSHLRLAFARGSRASPAAVMDGDRLGSLIYSGWDGSTFQNPAAVFGKVVGSVSVGSVPAKLTFETGACFSGCANPRAERMVVMPDGKVGINTSSPAAQIHINNTANQPGLRIDSSAGTNALEIYNTGSGSATGLIFYVERATGNVYAAGNFISGGADVAERIDVSEAVEPGDVVEIDPDNPGKFRKAREALSTRVAGVISTAPGVVLGNKSAEHNDARPILALAGRVPVKATAKYGAIAVGDLLVSSPIPGYAMKCPEKSQCIGAVIGKALEPFTEGVGMIEVQVMLR